MSPLSPSAIVTTLRAAGCVFAEDEARLLIDTAGTPADLAAMVDRRVAGLPLEHVLGWARFCGLRIAVDPGVFVPRRRTGLLVRTAAAALAARPGAVVVDLWPLPATLRGRVDVLVANAPYVPTGELGLLPPEARVHEPRVALDGGADGLDQLRRVVAAAPGWLAPGGALVVETSGHQAPALMAAVARAGLVPGLATDDDLGATAITGSRTG
ncbi:MAG: hypothetical protein AUI10_02230 [Actinobacteria bacterium 13_2_20CM_2_72_6]|nr:MAG: hypothetical protein AUI10_02230 [Actinobacteria bacterium 13_2_20CM_2_72_6]